jgi:hypothetical protein
MKVDLTPLVRFMKHLPKDGDEELALLKCHLLVEEMLTKLIERNLSHPEHLIDARLGFFQKMCIARSLNDLEREAWIWEAVKRLNTARNALSHGLERERIDRKLEEFVTFVEAEKGAPDPTQLSQVFGRFQWAVFKVFSLLAVEAHFDPGAVLEIRKQTSTLLTADEEQAAAAAPAEPQS